MNINTVPVHYDNDSKPPFETGRVVRGKIFKIKAKYPLYVIRTFLILELI